MLQAVENQLHGRQEGGEAPLGSKQPKDDDAQNKNAE